MKVFRPNRHSFWIYASMWEKHEEISNIDCYAKKGYCSEAEDDSIGHSQLTEMVEFIWFEICVALSFVPHTTRKKRQQLRTVVWMLQNVTWCHTGNWYVEVQIFRICSGKLASNLIGSNGIFIFDIIVHLYIHIRVWTWWHSFNFEFNTKWRLHTCELKANTE